LSKARQLDLLARLGLRAPASRVVSETSQILPAALQLAFPLIVKPNVGGSGALMRQFETLADLETALAARDLDTVFGIDHTALVQEYHPPRDGAIVRVEVLDGAYLYAIRIHNDPSQGFNLCPADICQTPDGAPTSTLADFDNCPVEITTTPARQVDVFEPPRWIVDSVLRLANAARLDLGGIEYLESERDRQVYFYDVNALSNFVADAPRVIGFDPFVQLVDLIERRWRAA
jgi:glutathione synthase/RimK-type ligase-like ATP-grasp enzyme